MNKSQLQLVSVSKSFIHNNQTVSIFNNINATFTQGNSYAITGKSGIGKSTLLHLIAGLDTPTTGSIFFNAIQLNALSSQQHATFLNTYIGFVFQSSHMIKELSILENVMLPGLITNTPTQQLKEKALQLLEKVGLSHKIHSAPGELSGGQQQRATLARALINEPAFLIADEPTGNLDNHTSTMIIELLLSCHKEWRMGLIVSSHDLSVVHSMNEIFELKNATLQPQPKDNTLCFQQKKFSPEQYK